MKVLIVCNNAYTKGNGVATVLHPTIEKLRSNGVDVKLMCSENLDPNGPQPDIRLPHFNFGPWENVAMKNGFAFAKRDTKIMSEAIKWADVIHIADSFMIGVKAVHLARKFGKPCVATFHIFPQNVLWQVWPLYNSNLANNFLIWFWNVAIYNKCKAVQCPAEVVRKYLERHHCKAPLSVISNGIDINPEPLDTSAVQKSPRILAMICRFAKDKSPMTLLDAMKYCRNRDDIQIYFAGNGTKKEQLMRKADEYYKKGYLKYKPVFGFYNSDELHELRKKAYLYIHCAKLEVEGLSCLESINDGLVPIITRGEIIATSQFAIDDRSVFDAGDYKALADKIDYWMEHPKERDEAAALYKEKVKQYDQNESVRKIIEMYKSALNN